MNEFLAGILSGINSVVNNYGWAIVVFTILIKLLLSPLDYKSRKSMRRMTALQPQVARLQKKYANDKEKLNAKTAELYKKEHINPMSGCLPMLLSFPILIWMFAAMRVVSNTELAKQAIDLITTGVQQNETWLWVKNLWMPDSPFAATIVDLNSLKMIPADIWAKVFAELQTTAPDVIAQLSSLGIAADTINGETIFAVLQNSPAYLAEMQTWATMPEVNLLLFKLTIYANNNGWFVLPILAAVTQFLMTILQPQQPTAAPADGAANPAGGMNGFMKWFFPLFSLYICSSYTAGFSLYWVVSNIFAAVQSLIFNKMFDAQEKKQAQQEVLGEGTIK